MSHQPSRREFLQAGAIVAGSFILPKNLRASGNNPSFFFIHADSCNSWPVTDPVAWCLQNAREPVLERASEGLGKLTPDDGDRIIRLVVRRCRLNLIELHPGRVVVHHWGQQGRVDLRPWFKMHGLARPDIKVVVRDRKREVAVVLTGDDFLYGDRIATDWPLALFQNKWVRRFEQEADDWTAAPRTWSGFAWDGVEEGRIPWTALKSAWRRSAGLLCLNCSGETFLANFGLRQVGIFNRSPHFLSVCSKCRRSFRDESVRDVAGWMALNLDAEVLPGFEMVWGRRVKVEPARASDPHSSSAIQS